MASKNSVNTKLDRILTNQEKLMALEKRILKEEKKIEDYEVQELDHEKSEDQALKELEELEKEIKENMSSPLKKVTSRDAFKGMIGALVGLIGHFAFTKATDVAYKIDPVRATILYFVAIVILVVMLYYTGFRHVEKVITFKFLPLRALVLYLVSILTIIVIYLLFGVIGFDVGLLELYQIIGGSIVLAVLGAATADLIGREE